MRKYIVCVLFVALIVMLSGCVTLHFTWDFLHDTDEIDRIEVFYQEEGSSFDLSDGNVPVAEIEPEDYANFCAEIKKIDFTDTILLFPAAVDPSFYLGGYVVKIIYQNGDYEIICDQGFQFQEVLEGSGGSNYHYSFPESFNWSTFVEQYIQWDASHPTDP